MSYYNNKHKKLGKDDDDDPVEAIGKVVEMLASVAFVTWDAYKLFTGSESSSRKEAHVGAFAYPNSQMLPGAGGGGGGGPFRPSSSAVGPIITNEVALVDQWCCPAKGWVKVNTDASLRGRNPSSVAIGGVIRDRNGAWKIGFAGKILSCNVHEAELFAVRVGLEIAWERGFKKIELETDCESAKRLFKGEQEPLNDLQEQLVQDCTELRKRNWTVRLKHVYREANEVADRMAELGHTHHHKIRIFELPPEDKRLQKLLAREKSDSRAKNKVSHHGSFN